MKKLTSKIEQFYQIHVFCCINVRPPNHPRGCCAAQGSIALRDYMKIQVKKLGRYKIRINNSGCLDRCELGPTMVIYPEGCWYHYKDKSDIDEIISSHILHGKIVKRLFLGPTQKSLS